MKKGSILIMAVAIMASVASCNKSDDTQFTPESGIPVTLKFTASSSPETRIAYDGKEGKWEADDKVYVVVTDTKDTEYESESCTVIPIGDGATATIDAKFTIGEGTEIKKLTAYHASDNMVVSYDGGNIDFSLPDTPDGTLSYLTTSAYTYDEGSEPTVEQGSDIELSATTLKFKHILARIDITTDIENVSSITLSDNGKDKLMTIKGGKKTYQIGFIPVKFASATTMKATVITDTKAYTKEVELTEIVAATLNTLDLTTSKMTEATVITGNNFQPIVDKPDGNFVLTEDLTLTEIPHLEGFSGTLDGNGHSIDISGAGMTDNEYGGIFATTEGEAAVTNLTVVAGERSADIVEGGVIVGRVNSGTLTLDNVHASGNIEADRRNVRDNSYVGGIVGAVETSGEFETGQEYKGVTEDNGSYIVNCKYSGTLTNTATLGAYTPEIYTGGIAGRSTGLIKDCSVTDVTINAETDNDGSGRQAKPILGNDWYEYVYNDNNSYTSVTINGEAPRTGIYKGSKAAGTDTPSYSDLQ